MRAWAQRAHPALTLSLFPLQLMMQYLYHGGTESMDIPTADILEVRIPGDPWGRGPPVHVSPFTLACVPLA